MKLNYCVSGRCEVLLEDERYVYLEEGNLSIDSNAPKNDFIYPGGRYDGLEIILDLEELREKPVQAFADCGFLIGKLEEELNQNKGSSQVQASREWKDAAEKGKAKLENACGER